MISPEIMAQKAFEADAQEAKKVGPIVLNDWIKNGRLTVLDIVPAKDRAKFGALKSFQKWDLKSPLKVSKTSTIVLVGSHQEMGAVQKVQKNLGKRVSVCLYFGWRGRGLG